MSVEQREMIWKIFAVKEKICKQPFRKQKYPSYQDFQLFVKPTFNKQLHYLQISLRNYNNPGRGGGCCRGEYEHGLASMYQMPYTTSIAGE